LKKKKSFESRKVHSDQNASMLFFREVLVVSCEKVEVTEFISPHS